MTRIDRRQFLATAGAAAAAFTIVGPQSVRGAEANSKIALGLVGCGGRGSWIADLFEKHGGYQVVAAADYFADKVNPVGDRFKIDVARRHTGLSGYRKLLDGKVDAVAFINAPYFFPEQTTAAVAAGKHVYVAKPIAVDVPGCKAVGEAGKKATADKRAFLVDFQTRASEPYREAVKRVHNGDIGRIACVEVISHAGGFDRAADPGTPEARLRNWLQDIALSGDYVVSYDIHATDVLSWVLDDVPVSATGTCGRARVGRQDVGDARDHFAVLYKYPNNITVSFSSRHFNNGDGYLVVRAYGPRGYFDSNYYSHVRISGETPYAGANFGDLYTDGAVANIAQFHSAITQAKFDNPTVAPSVRSNLTCLLARAAATKGGEVTWDDMMKANEKVEADLKGLKE